jgi:hypothetical protein
MMNFLRFLFPHSKSKIAPVQRRSGMSATQLEINERRKKMRAELAAREGGWDETQFLQY